MLIPDRVRIGSIDYEVIDKDTIVGQGVQCYGLIDFEQCHILLDAGIQSQQKLELTYLHEVVHGLLYSRSLKEAAANEELVDEIAIALHQLIRDNPEMFLPEDLLQVLYEEEVVEEEQKEEQTEEYKECECDKCKGGK